MPKVLQVRDLAIGYDDEVLLDEIAFEVQRGEVFLILGGSGSGKSTLLRTLIGLQPPLRGSVSFDGEQAADADEERPRFGVLFQSGALFGSMTLAQNVALPLERWTRLSEESIDALVRW